MKLPDLNLPTLMRKYGLYADKRLGQNFLLDDQKLLEIIEAAELNLHTWVLEIGAGLGNLTRLLAIHSRFVAAVELDTRLIPALREVVSPFDNVKVIVGDILEMDPAACLPEIAKGEDSNLKYCVVANIPYYITSAVIRHLLESTIKPQRIILTIQTEVAQRICAAPGDMSLLSLSVQVYGQPQIIASIPAGAFYPKPKVDSAILRIDLFPEPKITDKHIDIYFRLIKAGFSQKRKTLRNALKSGLSAQTSQVEMLLATSQIDPKRRAETLSISEWEILCENYHRLVAENQL